MSACNSHGQRKRKVDIATIIQDIELVAGQGNYSLALEKVEQALSQWGKCKELLTIRSSVSLELGELSKAAESLDDLVLLGDTSAYTGFLQLRLRFAKGERDLLADIKAVLQRKDIASAIKEKLYNLSGQCQRYLGNGAEAAKAYQQAVGYASDVYCKALEYSNYLFNMHYGAKTIQEECRAAEGYNDIFSSVPQFFHRPPEKKEKLRIGYISADIREHVVLKFAYAFFRSYDRQHFEVYCYARNYEDGYSRKVMEQVDGWRNITGMSAAEAARVIYADKIDILFDLSGHTQGSCLPILAYKPASLQISGIGYFATTGLKTVDYFLTDNYLLGGSAQAEPQLLESNGFTERLLVMPLTHFCYLPFNGLPEPGETPCRKNGYVTFGSFNNFTKVTDEVLTVWREILERVSDSRLLLKAEIFDRPEGRKAAETRLKKAGISLERIEFRGMTREYMNEYQDVDIALDTFPYPGGGTTFDALYMGVPVIALTGRTHGERFGISILHNLGLAELCTENTTEYIERAVNLANDRELLAILHQNLRTMLKNSPLMNEKQYMQDIEHGYRLMWEQYLAEYKPMSLREVSQKIPLLRELVIDREWQQAVELAAAIEVVEHLDGHILEELSGVYIDAKDGTGAERVTVRLLVKKPKDGYALFLRSRARFLCKDYAAVIRLAEQALASGTLDKSQEILTLDAIAKANKECGQAEQAIAAYWRTVEMADSLSIKRQQYDNYLVTLHYTAADGKLFKQRAEEYNILFKDVKRCKLLSRHHNKLRIGYVSPDFCKHVMSNFSRGLLKEYDRSAFEVYAYDTGIFYDEITKEFEAYPDVWRDISRMSDAEAAEQIVADEIDILVDLAGHTQGNRLGLFAYKPAPIQISGIGYMSTTGLQAIDYFLGDCYLDDEKAQDDFIEKLLILPHSHFLYIPWQAPAVTGPAPCYTNGYITFGCFNNFTKVADEILSMWAKILAQVPDSRLFLKAAAFDDAYSRKQAEQRLQLVGIPLDRVDFAGWSNDYFAAYELVDIALDTYPYPGGGTTCDALYMGVPVISLAGRRHGTRFGYSLLSNVGLGDLCAWTTDEYVDKAIQLANDIPRLQELHLILRRRLQASAVGNAERYMAELEIAYQKVWIKYLVKNSINTKQKILTALQTAVNAKNWQTVIEHGAMAYCADDNPENQAYIASALATAYYRLNSLRRIAFWVGKALVDDNTYITRAELYAIAEGAGSKTGRFVEAKLAGEIALKEYKITQLKMAPDTETSIRTAIGHDHFVFGLSTAADNYRKAMLTDSLGLIHKAAMYSSMLLSWHLGEADMENLYREHCKYQDLFTGIKPYSHLNHPIHKKLRIGYLSPDFRHHVMYPFIFPLLANYNREKFEVVCFSLVKKPDEYTKILQNFIDEWHDISSFDLEKRAQTVYEADIDILFDLAGHSSDSGLPILAYKPAPVQISGLGYMDTTGLNTVDYYLADEQAIPLGNEQYFTEKILRLKTMFCVAGRELMPESAGTPAQKTGKIVFGVFNNYRKYQDEILLVWKEILNRVPGSCLRLKCDVYLDPLAADIAFGRLKKLGFDMNRVQIEPASQDYLYRYLDIDIALDTFPWPGGGTTVDALYMGVPVVSLYGERFGSRFGLSILTAAGLSELAVNNVTEYIERAVSLAKDVETLDVLHKNLRKMIIGSKLFAADDYLKDLEEQYCQIWTEYLARNKNST